METKWIKPFIYLAGGILLAMALIRFIIAAGDAQILSLSEPMLGIPIRQAVLIVGGLELVVAMICLFGKRAGLQIGLLAWMSVNFIVFQIGLLWMHFHIQATCLGSLTDPLHLMRGKSGLFFPFFSALLLVGSCLAFWKLPRAIRSDSTDELKISCPQCNGHIAFPAHGIGQRIPCPHCAATVILEKPQTA